MREGEMHSVHNQLWCRYSPTEPGPPSRGVEQVLLTEISALIEEPGRWPELLWGSHITIKYKVLICPRHLLP